MQDLDPNGDGARRLLAAILWRACQDAGKGDGAARDWLATDGALWADDLDIRPERVRQWAVKPRTTRPPRAKRKDNMETNLERTTFATSRLLEFFSEKELTMQIGHKRDLWPVALVKELIDNALDACECANVAPEITVTVDADYVSVQDNGPGLPVATLERSLDYLVRVSNKAYYVSPTRGQLGNALKCVWAAPFVATGGERGRVDVTTGGLVHQIDVTLDRIGQRPELAHTVNQDGLVKTGTLVKMHWPGIAGYLLAKKKPDFYNRQHDYNLFELMNDYPAFNPHVTFTLIHEGKERTTKSKPAKWEKWLSDCPTSPHWYTAGHLQALVGAYLTDERGGGRARTVREFVSEFRGLSATAKQKAVTERANMSGAFLHDLIDGGSVSLDKITSLLEVMKAESRAVKPGALGVLGKGHLTQHLAEREGVKPESIRYKKVEGAEDGTPFVLEVAFGVYTEDAEDRHRRVVTGLNWSPTLGMLDEVSSVLGEMRVDRFDPVVIFIHLAKPRVEFADHGKSAWVMNDED